MWLWLILIKLLIDLQVVKGYLTKMPGESLVTNMYAIFFPPFPVSALLDLLTLHMSSSHQIGSYTKALTKTTTRLEALLKVIVTPVVRGVIGPYALRNFVLNWVNHLSGSERELYPQLHIPHWGCFSDQFPKGNALLSHMSCARL